MTSICPRGDYPRHDGKAEKKPGEIRKGGLWKLKERGSWGFKKRTSRVVVAAAEGESHLLRKGRARGGVGDALWRKKKVSRKGEPSRSKGRLRLSSGSNQKSTILTPSDRQRREC